MRVVVTDLKGVFAVEGPSVLSGAALFRAEPRVYRRILDPGEPPPDVKIKLGKEKLDTIVWGLVDPMAP